MRNNAKRLRRISKRFGRSLYTKKKFNKTMNYKGGQRLWKFILLRII